MSDVILDVDMGNSRIKWRLRCADQQQSGISDYQSPDWVEKAEFFTAPGRVRVSCVAGEERRRQFARLCQRQWNIVAEFATVQDYCGGVQQGYRVKERLGVDRWLGLLAAKRQVGGCIVLSCGSAVTVDLLLASGRHLGGYIVPGITLMHQSLFSGTDAVKVDVAQTADLEPGCDTVEAVNKGVVAMVKGLVDHARVLYRREACEQPQILITGGDGEMVQAFLPANSIYNSHLVLDGLPVALP